MERGLVGMFWIGLITGVVASWSAQLVAVTLFRRVQREDLKRQREFEEWGAAEEREKMRQREKWEQN